MCALLLSATLLLGFVAGDWRTSLYTAVLLAACYPVYLVISARTRRSNA
jgi:Ca2+/Na+ antiporter